MALQVRVRVRYCYEEEKLVSVASSREEFDQFTIKQLKDKISQLRLFPEIDEEEFCVMYDNNVLKDDQTFGSCLIEPQSLLMIQFMVRVILQAARTETDRGVPRTRSMEILASMEQTNPESENQCCVL